MTQTFGELNVVVSQKERLVAFLLCFFLGVFGAHRFYAGRTLSAVSILVLNIIGINKFNLNIEFKLNLLF